MSEAYVCPEGYDCIYATSCPAAILPCPEGYLCTTYEGNKFQKELDFKYADLFADTVTEADAWKFAEPGRYVQVSCLQGFSCPTGLEVKACEEGHWCSENTVTQPECTPLSMCPTNAAYQINFIDIIIMLVLTIVTAVMSSRLRRIQRNEQVASRTLAPKDSLLEVVPGASANAAIGNVEIGVRVVFKDLVCVKGMNTILPGISGSIPANKVTCILGPMSCGKSTLLSAIRSGCRDCLSGGIRLIRSNDQKCIPVAHYPQYVGFVPQEDVLDRNLTVRETLMFNAISRVPELYYDRVKAEAVVDRVLSDLAIRHIAGTIIGGGPSSPANISGGQVKRVNIACELVALNRPGVLLLDEPTSGLDASVALDLVKTLKTVARSGITIVMVLQQPRSEIFESLDQLFLMQGDGNIVYQGDSLNATEYLSSIGYEHPEETSDADFCIDVLNDIVGVARMTLEEARLAKQSGRTIDLLVAWQQSELCHVLASELSDVFSLYDERCNYVNETSSFWADFVECSKSYFRIFELNVFRLWLVRLRNVRSLVTYFAIHVIMAIALSSGFSILIQGSYNNVLRVPVPSSLSSYYPAPLVAQGYNERNVGDLGFRQLLFFMSGSIGCAASLATVPVFSGSSAIITRETQSGLSVIASSVGRICADTLFVIWNAMVFCGVWTAFGHSGSFCDWIAVIVATSFASSGLGYIFGVFATPANASVFSIVITFTFCVFSGVDPTLSQIEGLPVVNWAWYVSFATWTAESTYKTWTAYLTRDHGENTVSTGSDFFGFQVDSFDRPMGALVAIGVMMRVIAVAILYYRTKK